MFLLRKIKCIKLLLIATVIILIGASFTVESFGQEDLCETNREVCGCNPLACANVCIEPVRQIIEQAATHHICNALCGAALANPWAAVGCLICIGQDVQLWTYDIPSCLGYCSADPCSKGYECHPCVDLRGLPYCSSGDETNLYVQACSCSGQGWYGKKVTSCPNASKCQNGGCINWSCCVTSNGCIDNITYEECEAFPNKIGWAGQSCGDAFPASCAIGCCKTSNGCIENVAAEVCIQSYNGQWQQGSCGDAFPASCAIGCCKTSNGCIENVAAEVCIQRYNGQWQQGSCGDAFPASCAIGCCKTSNGCIENVAAEVCIQRYNGQWQQGSCGDNPECNKCNGVNIDDNNKCTIDWCDPLTGKIYHEFINCDDGNPCTVDYCDAEVGCSSTRVPNCQEPSPPPPGGPGTGPGGGGGVPVPLPIEPNSKIGPLGFGDLQFIAKDQLIFYTINFENASDATSPANRVLVSDLLDTDLDWRTFRLKEVGFGDVIINIPENRSFYQTRISLGSDYNNMLLDIDAGINVLTGEARWIFTTIDPATGMPPENPLFGFLPPNDENHSGEGYVIFTIKPKPGLPTGTKITNKAVNTFDTTEPVETNEVSNTIDGVTPSSAVASLPEETQDTSITVMWSGQDDEGGSGLESYDIYVSDNEAAYELWLGKTTDISDIFSGQPGHSYRFYSMAHDNAGNMEAPPAEPDAVTTIGSVNNPPNVPSSPSPADGVTDIAVNVALNWQGGDPDAGDTITYDVYLDTSNPPVTKVSSNQSDNSYQAKGLSYGTTYYWKIIARDNNGDETAGPVWNFTTVKEQFTLAVTTKGTGSGTVSDGKNINCIYNGTTSQGTCSDIFYSSDTVTLTAAPDTGSSFAGWSGDCAGNDLSTSVLIDGVKTCTATFNDAIPPVSTITSPKAGHIMTPSIIVRGIASDTGSGVQKVEVSTDGGTTWNLASGTSAWSYEWIIPLDGTYTIKSRATDSAGNIETPSAGMTVTVVQRQPTPVTISGRQLLVNGNPFMIRGVGYSPVPIGDDPETTPPYGDYFTSDYSSIYDRDLPLLRDVGANTVRLWNWNNIADHFDFLEKAYNGGVNPTYVIAGYWIDSGLDIDPNSLNNVREQLKADFREMVAVHKNHPAILMWAIGNGLNADEMYGGNLDNIFSLINEMAEEAHGEEGVNYHPVTTALIDVDVIDTISTYDTSVPALDIWAANVYRGNTFGSLFNDYKSVSSKPFVILEYGIDAYDDVHGDEYEKIGIPYQADYAEALWKEIESNSDICIGGSIVEYSDEWWKGKLSTDLGCTDIDPEVHGICGYAMSSHPDGYSNEEWWGIMRIIDNGTNPDIMESRAVYNRLQSLWIRAITVEKTGTGSGTVTSSDGKINCGSDCSETYNTVTEITLTAIPDTGSVFGGWSGCTPTPEDAQKCTVTIGNMVTIKATFQKDTNPPTGSIVINGGAEATNNRSVVLTLSASDDSGGPIQMCISNTSSCKSWETFATTKSRSLTSGDGTKTVYAWFRDQWGNVNTTPYSDTIILDTTAPIDGTVTAIAGDAQVMLNWAGFTDALSGIGSYKVVYSTKSAPRSCSTTDTVIYDGTDTTYPHTGLTNGTTYYYRVCAIDKAGNMSSGATTSVRPIPETNPPTGSIVINGGAEATNNRSVVLTLSASDDSGGSIQMCISNTSSCKSWETFVATKSWTLTSRSETKTVNAWFKDQWENITPTPYSDTIILDTIAPVNGTVTATPGNTQVTLNWQGFTDALSGMDSYKVVYSTKSAPHSCSSGTAIYTGTDTTYPHTGLTNGTTYYYRVCAIDKAGNMSSGTKVSARPQL